MYVGGDGCRHLIYAFENMGIKPTIYNYADLVFNKINLLKFIAQSHIPNWVLSGSNQSIYGKDKPKIPLGIFNIFGKKFFLICYSMESALNQLGCPVLKRGERMREMFNVHIQLTKVYLFGKERLFHDLINPPLFWRNHHYYTPSYKLDRSIQEVASYRGELMIAFHKNATMTQFHPERTVAGKRLLSNWLYDSDYYNF